LQQEIRISSTGLWSHTISAEIMKFPYPAACILLAVAHTSALPSSPHESSPAIVRKVVSSSNTTQDLFLPKRKRDLIPRIFIEKGCNDIKKHKIESAWYEARSLALSQTDFRFDYDASIPHTHWLGDKWNSKEKTGWFGGTTDYGKIIGENFSRLTKLFSVDAQVDEYIYWHCNDEKNACGPGTVAYSWDSNGWLWSNHYTVFCNMFYDSATMEEQLYPWSNDKDQRRFMENFQLNRGQVMLHEIYHYGTLVTRPRTDDYAYQANRTWNLARIQGTSQAYINADSYALDAVAIYVQKHYNDPQPPRPERVVREEEGSLALLADRSGGIEAQAKNFGTDGPPGWIAPSSAGPDLSIWEPANVNDAQPAAPVTQGPPSPPPPQQPDVNSCHGISGDYWVMSRDVAAGNVQDFCQQSSSTKKYNEGSVNELELSVRDANGAEKDPRDAPDCESRLRDGVIDGCDGADKVNNPFNYKFGSTLKTGDGWEYKMTPLSKQVNEVACDVAYKFFFDGFEIRGKNLPNAKLGAAGEGLLEQLRVCGVVSEWQFERTPQDCCFQWYAAGRLPIGTRSCVGSALVAAGGANDGWCKGAGKRSLGGSSIDDWPGYDDEGRHVFGNQALVERDSISKWPGYGEEGRHVFNETQNHRD
jgi:hypothetical protein